jgi:hypothetical protein
MSDHEACRWAVLISDVGSFSRYEIEKTLLVGLWLGMKCSVDDWTLL